MKQEMKKALAGTVYAGATKKNPVKIDLKKRVTIYTTASAPFNAEDEEIQVSELLSAYMIGKGWATETKPKGKEKKEDK